MLQTGLWVNHDLSLRGEPDGIEMTSGTWVPVEVKHHSQPSSLDRLELAFYWLLLTPHRIDSTRPRARLLGLGRHRRTGRTCPR
jgi:hypothetical protein